MAESAVTLLIDVLRPIVENEVRLLRGVHDEVKDIMDEMESMVSCLREADRREDDNEGVKTWLKQLRDAAYDTEDVVEEYLLHLASLLEGKGRLVKFIHRNFQCALHLRKRHQIAIEMRGIKSRVQRIAAMRERLHRQLIRGFFNSASHMLRPDGEIHINHKKGIPYLKWNLKEYAEENSLVLIECVDFKSEDYPSYENKRGDGSNWDKPFFLGDCGTFKFAIGHAHKKPKAMQSNQDFKWNEVVPHHREIPFIGTTEVFPLPCARPLIGRTELLPHFHAKSLTERNEFVSHPLARPFFGSSDFVPHPFERSFIKRTEVAFPYPSAGSPGGRTEVVPLPWAGSFTEMAEIASHPHARPPIERTEIVPSLNYVLRMESILRSAYYHRETGIGRGSLSLFKDYFTESSRAIFGRAIDHDLYRSTEGSFRNVFAPYMDVNPHMNFHDYIQNVEERRRLSF